MVEEKFYFINSFMEVDEGTNDEMGRHLRKRGNYFNTKHDALMALEKIKLINKTYSKIMNAMELRKGSIVLVDGTPRRVTNFDDDFIVVGMGRKVKIHKVEPSPITSEFLLSHGFEEIEGKVESYSKVGDGYNILLLKPEGEPWKVVINNEPYVYAGVANFLHEFQDALYACKFTI